MMKARMILGLAAVASLGIASGAMAGTASGPGGPIPPSGTGGGSTWPTLPAVHFSSTTSIGVGVAGVKSVTFTSLTHTWMGDLHAVLFNPAGTGFNIFVRPVGGGPGLGSSGDFAGTYTFIDGGAPLPALSGTAVVPPGTYGQSDGTWVSGTGGIMNGPLSAITGGAGTWTLRIYDWAGGDVGSLGGWTVDYNPVPAPAVLGLLGVAGLASRRRRA